MVSRLPTGHCTIASQALSCSALSCRINNAGTNAYKFEPLINNIEAELISIVETNVLGTMLCCKEASVGFVQHRLQLQAA